MTEAQPRFGFYERNPAQFIADVLRDPETGKPFELLPAELAFLELAFQVDEAGRLLHPEQLYAAIKKSGKTAFAAMVALFMVLVLGGSFAEAYILANDFEQSQGRVFTAIKRIVRASPLLTGKATITANKIEFSETGATIIAIASDYAGAAGANPCIAVFDEMWGYTSERSRRLWDEMVPPPTRRIACRLVVTYAGFDSESELLQDLYKRGLQQPLVGRDLRAGNGILMFWSHEPIAPWQTPEWLNQMRQQLRPNAYLRMIENRWVTGQESFIDMRWWDDCIDPSSRPLVADKALPIWVGVDASVKRDSTAIVAISWDRHAKKVRIVWHRIFQPSPDEPLDFETTIEATLRSLAQRFKLREVRYDPYQMQASAQRLRASSIKMIEYAQTVPGLTVSSTNLYELIKSHGLIAYPSEEIRRAISQAIALETPRGWRIAKEKQSHRIDVVVALAMAAFAAVEQSETRQIFTGVFGYGGPVTWLHEMRNSPSLVLPDPDDPDVIQHRERCRREAESRRDESIANIRARASQTNGLQ